MIQKIQKLKAKKGFTLVELIVVIAIIGVLAAILIPTMLNFVTQANVASANTTAASIQDRVNEWLTKLNAKGEGMKLSDSAKDYITVNITTDASGVTTWTVDGLAKTTNTDVWAKAPTSAGPMTLSSTKVLSPNAKDAKSAFGQYLLPMFPDMKEGTIVVYIVGGNCVASSFSPTQGIKDTITGLFGTDFEEDNWKYEAGEDKFKDEGLLDSGEILGTSPAIKK